MAGLRAILAGAAGAAMLAITPAAYANDAAESFNRQVSETTVSPEVQAQIEAVEAQAREDALNGTPVVLYNPNEIDEFDRRVFLESLEDYNPLGISARETLGQSKVIVPFTNEQPIIERDIENSDSFANADVKTFIRRILTLADRAPVVVASLD